MRGIFLIAVLLALAIVGYLNLAGTKELTDPTPSAAQNSAEAVEKEVERLADEHIKRLEDVDR